jgi:anti-sigma regulatory factor (Ser/Thr protein kinase)
LFQHLNIQYTIPMKEHEEAGRFMPLRKVSTHSELSSVIGDVSALLHLDQEPDGLAAVRYCVSELIRNVLEHSQSPEGAFVCAQRYFDKEPKRVTIAVADCGIGIQRHLGKAYPEALADGLTALRLAMRPGITGAQKGMYGGTPDNAGAGLFITRAIAKATGGYFVLLSGSGAFRLRRSAKSPAPQLFVDPFDETKSDRWSLEPAWEGTVAATEIMTDRIPNFPNLFQWIRKQLPASTTVSKRIKFI